MTARQIAYLSLVSLLTKDKYSNIEVDSMISKYSLQGKDKAFYTNIVYGVIERKLTLEYFLSSLSDRENIDINIKVAIYIGLYQIFYLDSTPDFASVNESVELVKWAYNTKESSSKFVNAILREAIRQKDKLSSFKSIKDDITRLSIEYSVAPWLVCRLINQYSIAKTTDILKSTFLHPKLTLRCNTLKTSPNELLLKLQNLGISCYISKECPTCIIFNENIPYNLIADFEDLFFIQDLSSQICSYVLNPKPGDTILDACACPGGKSFNLAMQMNDKGKIVSRDLHKNKLSLITSGAEKLGIHIIETQVGSSSEDLGNVMYDKIICDVPCSGFGVMAKKPEIRYKKEEDILKLPQIQYSILDNCSKCLKPGGELVYSTCTILKEENEDIISKFLLEHEDFVLKDFIYESSPQSMVQILPNKTQDGFFISKLQKKE